MLADLLPGDKGTIAIMAGAVITIFGLYIYMAFIASTFKNTYKIITDALSTDQQYNNTGEQRPTV